MRAVVQRVTRAEVHVGDRLVGAIAVGLLVFVGVERDDGMADVDYIAAKVRDLRIFDDGTGRMNRSVGEIGGRLLVVSQFTLAGDVRRGRRPSFDHAAPADLARHLYGAVIDALRQTGLGVETGEFQATMRVSLENDGPVTMLIDSRRRF